jgi:hypothetical protein
MKALSAVIAVLLCTAVPAKAGDRPSPYFKGVKVMSYWGAVQTKGRCAIDLNAWNTAMDFIANQSFKLKLIREQDREQLGDEMDKAAEELQQYRKINGTNQDTPEGKGLVKHHEEARERYGKYAFAPRLTFVIETLEQAYGCFGSVNASVTVVLETAKIEGTETIMSTPSVEIWHEGTLISGPFATFSSYAIQTSEQIMKKLVNDWAKAQED